MSFSELTADANKLAADYYDDQSFVYWAKRQSQHFPHRMPATWHGVIEMRPT